MRSWLSGTESDRRQLHQVAPYVTNRTDVRDQSKRPQGLFIPSKKIDVDYFYIIITSPHGLSGTSVKFNPQGHNCNMVCHNSTNNLSSNGQWEVLDYMIASSGNTQPVTFQLETVTWKCHYNCNNTLGVLIICPKRHSSTLVHIKLLAV